MKSRRAQEEMVGFTLIIIIIAIILLVFLSFSLRRSSNQELIESYEIESFIQTFLKYNPNEKSSIKNMIKDCVNKGEGCNILKTELENIMESSWKFGEEDVIKGYDLKIGSEYENIIEIKKGNETSNYESYKQHLQNIEIEVNIYS